MRKQYEIQENYTLQLFFGVDQKIICLNLVTVSKLKILFDKIVSETANNFHAHRVSSDFDITFFKGCLISEDVFTLVQGWKKCEKSLSKSWTKLKIPSEIKLPLSKRGHFFNAQKNLRRSADPHKSPKTWFDRIKKWRRVGVVKYGVG